MKAFLAAVIVFLSIRCALPAVSESSQAGRAKPRTRLLVVYGGHEFETNQFWQVFRDNPEVTFTTAEYPAAQDWFKPERAREFDVLVFYDMCQTISDESKSNLVSLIKGGKPLLALHHTLASFQSWPEYASIIGGRYYLKPWKDHGVDQPASTYQHDVDFTVTIADPQHPITRGVGDFAIHDETYGAFEMQSGSHALLQVDAPTSSPNIAWCKEYGAGRVVYLQLGHDHQAYANPKYRQLVAQSIRWVAQQAAN